MTVPSHIRLADAFAWAVVVLAAIAAAAGVLLPNLYRDTEAMVAQAQGSDLATLIVAVPVLAVGLWHAHMMRPGQAKTRQEVRRVTAPAIEAYTETRITVCERAMRIVRGGTGEPVVFLHHSTGSLGWLELHANLAADFDVLAKLQRAGAQPAGRQ